MFVNYIVCHIMDFLNLFFYVKGGRVRGNLVFKYGGQELEIVT